MFGVLPDFQSFGIPYVAEAAMDLMLQLLIVCLILMHRMLFQVAMTGNPVLHYPFYKVTCAKGKMLII